MSLDEECNQIENIDLMLNADTDLRLYSQEVAARLQDAETAMIADCMKQAASIIQLHRHVTTCDTVLSRVEHLLSTFQQDLGSISGEIIDLHQQSVQMNQQLKNRQSVRDGLSQFIDSIIVPESLINAIMEAPVTDEEFHNCLAHLDEKLTFIGEQSLLDIRACADISSVLKKLQTRALSRIRAFILDKIHLFRKPMSNFHIPQSALLKHKYFYSFTLAHDERGARSLVDEYISTSGKVYYSYFNTYLARLAKLVAGIPAPGKTDLLTAPGSARCAVFSLGARANILRGERLHAPAIVPHHETTAPHSLHIEEVFRSVQFLLADNACREYSFTAEFFHSINLILAADGATSSGVSGRPSADSANIVYERVMYRCTQHVLRWSSSWANQCEDSVALLACVHVVYRLQMGVCHKRAISALDTYWHALADVLWQRFCVVARANVHALASYDTSELLCSPAGTSSASSGRHESTCTRPHTVTRRYAEYVAALSCINETLPHETAHSLLMQLQLEMENLLLRMAAEFSERSDQIVFLINNYDLILGVLVERFAAANTSAPCDGSPVSSGVPAEIRTREMEAFGRLMARRAAEYVEHVLGVHFGAMLQCVRACEDQRCDSAHQALRHTARVFSAQDGSWPRVLQRVHTQVMGAFSNFRQGSNILQDTLKLLVVYYDRFHKICGASTEDVCDVVDVHALMTEVKKYRPSF